MPLFIIHIFNANGTCISVAQKWNDTLTQDPRKHHTLISIIVDIVNREIDGCQRMFATRAN